MSDLWSEIEAADKRRFDLVRERVSLANENDKNVEALLSRCQLLQSLQNDPETAHFIAAAEKHISDRCRMITSTDADLGHHEAFLRRLLARPTRLPRIKLFTTNYDLCFERAAAAVRAVVVDGFTHTSPPEFDGSAFAHDIVTRRDDRDTPEYLPNVFQLLKLHGSVDWCEEAGHIYRGGAGKTVMIYPRDSKYQLSYSQPYLEMMARFQAALRTTNTGLVIAGFGFNDEHLAQPILSAIRSNVAMRIVIVDPVLKARSEGPSSGGGTHVQSMTRLVQAGDRRLMLLNGTFEQLVALLPEISVVPEAEAHRQRLGRAAV